MKTKEETLIFMEKWKEIFRNKASFDEVLNTGEDDFLSALIDAAPTVIEAYEDYGRGGADMQTEFHNIFYREDCYDYLIGRDFKHEDALELSEQIRKGRYGFYEHSILHQLLVGVDFCEWAKGVRYLPSRQKIFDLLKD